MSKPPDHDDESARQRTNMIVLGVALALLAVGLFLLYAYKKSADELDCFAANHRDCVPVDQPSQ
jgi:ABC-type uncharacterized transport system permease subunit